MSTAICKTCGGQVPFGHMPSEFDPLGAGHPAHELRPTLSEILNEQEADPMTNYNERLDEILDGGVEGIQDGVAQALRVGQNIDYHTSDAKVELRQALTSLIKELVAEANLPNEYQDRLLKMLENENGIDSTS